MSGFETVAAALGIVQLAKHTITGLCQLLREYNVAGALLFEMVGDFDCFQERLDVWSKMWHLVPKGNSGTESHVRMLWGETSAEKIMMQLASIDECCRQFTKLIASLMGIDHLVEYNLQSQLFAARLLDSSDEKSKPLELLKGFTRDSRVRKYRDMLRAAQKATTTKAKAEFILRKRDSLKELLKDMDNKFTKLDDDSLRTFCLRHPSVSKSASQAEIVETIEAESRLDRALVTRNASRVIYDWCLKSRVGTLPITDGPDSSRSGQATAENSIQKLKLDLSLTEKSKATPYCLRYHCFALWSHDSQEQELLIEGPISPGAAYHTMSPHHPDICEAIDFGTACTTVLKKDSKRFGVANSASEDPNDAFIWFQSRYPVPNSVSSGKATSAHVRSLLENMQQKSFAEAFEEFPYAERFDLAYQVAECGLMLLGTPWLSDIRSARLFRIKNYTFQQYLFVLEVADGYSEGTLQSPDLLATVEPQTFMIGIILTEIAIAEPIVGFVQYTSQDGSQKLALKVTRLNDQGQKQDYAMKLGAAVRRVNNCMGLAYSEAVEFCLRQSAISRNPAWAQLVGGTCREAERDGAYKALLKDFHQKVFARLSGRSKDEIESIHLLQLP